MKIFDLNIQSSLAISSFFIRPITQANETVYQVWRQDTHEFSMESNKKPDAGFILTNEYADKQIDKELVKNVSSGIQKHYEL